LLYSKPQSWTPPTNPHLAYHIALNTERQALFIASTEYKITTSTNCKNEKKKKAREEKRREEKD